MTIYLVRPYLSEDMSRTSIPGYSYDPSVPYTRASVVSIAAASPEAAAEVAFSIFNSYPDEMHCDPQYSINVRSYRRFGHRSLSVGDYVTVDGVKFSCEMMGFKKIPEEIPTTG